MGSFGTRKLPSRSGAQGAAESKLALLNYCVQPGGGTSVCQARQFTPPTRAGCLNLHTATAHVFYYLV